MSDVYGREWAPVQQPTASAPCRYVQPSLTVTHDRGMLTINGVRVYTSSPSALCPDLLRYEQIGEADNLRGRVVRAFFWLMRVWPA